MNQRFDEDRAELEAHLAERVRAYVELGETPEQAALSAYEKFGDIRSELRKLLWRRRLRSPFATACVGFAVSATMMSLVSESPFQMALVFNLLGFPAGRWLRKQKKQVSFFLLGIFLSAILHSLLYLCGKISISIPIIVFFHLMIPYASWFGTWTKEWESSLLWKNWIEREEGMRYEIAKRLRY